MSSAPKLFSQDSCLISWTCRCSHHAFLLHAGSQPYIPVLSTSLPQPIPILPYLLQWASNLTYCLRSGTFLCFPQPQSQAFFVFSVLQFCPQPVPISYVGHSSPTPIQSHSHRSPKSPTLFFFLLSLLQSCQLFYNGIIMIYFPRVELAACSYNSVFLSRS